MKYIVGNWKSNKNLHEVNSWLDTFTSFELDVLQHAVHVVIAPPYPFILTVKERLRSFPWIKLAAQDVSPFGAGSYTGAVSMHNLGGIIDYCIIGHSERRKYFHETDAELAQKVDLLCSSNIEPILCVRNEHDGIPSRVNFVAYEPVKAIGTGDNESVDDVLKMKHALNLKGNVAFIYGGSANLSNVREYLSHSEIDGLLPGAASLNPQEFYDMCVATYALTK